MKWAVYKDKGEVNSADLYLTRDELNYISRDAPMQTNKVLVKPEGKGFIIRLAKVAEKGSKIIPVTKLTGMVARIRYRFTDLPLSGRTDVYPKFELRNKLRVLFVERAPEAAIQYKYSRRQSRPEPLYRPEEHPPTPVRFIPAPSEQASPTQVEQHQAPNSEDADYSQLKAAIELVNEEATRVGAVLRVENGILIASVVKRVDL